MDTDGDFFVAWTSYSQDGDGHGVSARSFDAVGNPRGLELRVNTYTTNHQRSPSVTVDAGGDFLVVWESVRDGSGYGIFARAFDAEGTALTGEVPVNSYTPNQQQRPVVAMPIGTCRHRDVVRGP